MGKVEFLPLKPLDNKSFEQLFRDEYKTLCFFANKYVKDLESAKEIVQEAFISLWEKRYEIDMDKAVKSYLSVTIRNKCLNYLRDNKKFNNSLIAAEMNDRDFSYEHKDGLAEDELRLKIENAMADLPEKCREVFLLSRNDNLKYNEIAAKLQISVKTVETQMSKALQHFRSRLGDYLGLLAFVLGYFLEK